MTISLPKYSAPLPSLSEVFCISYSICSCTRRFLIAFIPRSFGSLEPVDRSREKSRSYEPGGRVNEQKLMNLLRLGYWTLVTSRLGVNRESRIRRSLERCLMTRPRMSGTVERHVRAIQVESLDRDSSDMHRHVFNCFGRD